MNLLDIKTYEEIYGEKLTIKDLIEGFYEDEHTGRVVAFGGKLNVRPPYQREFIYEIPEQKAVIQTIMNGFPLNVMYWAKNIDNDGNITYELMDGQQRTMSICKFSEDAFSIKIKNANGEVNKTFNELGSKTKDFLNYPLTVYICEGEEDEKLDWFQIINIAGIKLTDQEMKNAIHTSKWTTDAKKYFSRIKGEGYASEGHIYNGHSYGEYLDVVGGTQSKDKKAVVRQYLLEIVLGWYIDKYNLEHSKENFTIDDIMKKCSRECEDAKDLWRYYEDVMEWVKKTFPTYRDKMKSIEWGKLYNRYKEKKNTDFDKKANELFEYGNEIETAKIYEAVLSNDFTLLNPRKFDRKKFANEFKIKYNEQNNRCPYCNKVIELDKMEGDHIKPWSKGGTTTADNLQLLCKICNIKKSNYDATYTLWDEKEYEDFDLTKWDTLHKNEDK